MFNVKIFIKWVLLLLVSTSLALVILGTLLFKLESSHTPDDAQVIGRMLWFPEPTARGLSIVESRHPIYRIRVTCGSPDEICHEGQFAYKGNKLGGIELTDFANYLGEEIVLKNGESLEPVE